MTTRTHEAPAQGATDSIAVPTTASAHAVVDPIRRVPARSVFDHSVRG